MQRKLFGINNLIEEFTASLILIKSSESDWEAIYYDEAKNEYWLRYVVEAQNFSRNLMLLSPRPTTTELMEIGFSSLHLDEVSAAATRLYLDETENKTEFRDELMKRLELLDISKMNSTEKERIKLIIQNSNLLHGINIREIVGKHYSEIEEDALFFRSISDKARTLFEKL